MKRAGRYGMVLLLAGWYLPVQGNEGSVPETWNTIQIAINNCVEAENLVVVYPGTYYENLTFANYQGGSLRLRSQDPCDPCVVAATVIDGQLLESVIRVNNGSGAEVVIEGFTIVNGRGTYGGGISCVGEGGAPGSSPTIRHCVLRNNEASFGGGIGCDPADSSGPTVSDCVIEYNEASQTGGGLYATNGSSPVITNSIFRGNVSDESGGGIYCYDQSHVRLMNVVLEGNGAGEYGGGLYAEAMCDPCLLGIEVIDNEASWYDGGGIYVNQHCDLSITAGTFTGNEAGTNGGGIAADDECTVTITDAVFTNNNAAVNGGGVSCANDTVLEMTRVSLSGHTADTGGGVCCLSSPSVLTDCEFYGNSAVAYGGGMYALSEDPALTGCVFQDNTVGNMYNSGQGGGLGVIACKATIASGRFESNEARGANGAGGGVFCSFGHTLISDTVFEGNGANREGGGVYYQSETGGISTLQGCSFTANKAERGGGVCGSARPGCSNVIFDGNEAETTGGAVYLKDKSPSFDFCTFTGNRAAEGAGALYLSGNSARLENSIVYFNRGDDPGATATGVKLNNALLAVEYCNMESGAGAIEMMGNSKLNWQIGNIDVDPCFVDAGGWTDEPGGMRWVKGCYILRSAGWRWDPTRSIWFYDAMTSRCIDAGNPAIAVDQEPATIPEYDPDNIWGINLRVNMGAYGNTMTASMPPYDWSLVCDGNNDGRVDLYDVAVMQSMWGENGDRLAMDGNRDRAVAMDDMVMLSGQWLGETLWGDRP